MADSSTPTNNVQVFIPAYLLVKYLDVRIHPYEPSLCTFSVHKDHKVFSSRKVYLLGAIILGEWFFFEPDIKALSFLLLLLFVILPPHPVNVHMFDFC